MHGSGASLGEGDDAVLERDVLHALPVGGGFCEEGDVGSGGGLAGVEVRHQFAAENGSLFDQHAEGLVEAGGAEFQAAGEGLFVVIDVAPGVEPRVLLRLPDVAEDEVVGGA